MPQTKNYNWDLKDLIARGGYGWVYKVSVFCMTLRIIYSKPSYIKRLPLVRSLNRLLSFFQGTKKKGGATTTKTLKCV